MNRTKPGRILCLIAVIAAVAIVLLLLVSQVHGTATPDWLAMLPVFFVGLIAPLSMVRLTAAGRRAFPPAEPLLACSFQRPPPSQIR